MKRIRIMAVLTAAAVLGGCAMSRVDQLERKADRVAAELKSEQKKVLASSSVDRAARLDRLTGLRATLSAANIGLGSVPHLVQPDQRDFAYDVLDEVYDTIEWNIPLGPNDPQRPMPSQFSGGVLKLN